MRAAQGVPALRFIVRGMVVLARLKDGLTLVLMGSIPLHGMPCWLDRERRVCAQRKEHTQPGQTEDVQLRVPVNMAAACSWP